MPLTYILKSHQLGSQHVLALAESPTEASCVEDVLKDGDPCDILGTSARSLVAMQAHGMDYAATFGLVRKIAKGIYLVELKSTRTARRMVAHLHVTGEGRVIPILLDTFKARTGKPGRATKAKVKALRSKAKAARRLIEQEDAPEVIEGVDLTLLPDYPRTPEGRAHHHIIDISESVWKRMRELGIDQEQLARMHGVGRRHVSHVLGVQSNMSLKTMSKLEHELGITLADTAVK